jgi:hypothetical protein
MLPGNQVNLNVVAEVLRDGVWHGDPWNRDPLSSLAFWKQDIKYNMFENGTWVLCIIFAQ